nr:hypothetical protein [Tanacetum cinerariifolium]
MHFLLSSLSVVYMLTTSMSEDGGDNPTVKQVRKRAKWDNDDYVCRGLILNVLEQYNELLGTLRRFTQHKLNMDKSIQVLCIIDKLLPSWKDFKHTLKHLKEELSLVELGSHLRIEESLKAPDNDKPKGNNVVGHSVVNMVEHNNSFRLGHVHFQRMQDMSKDRNKLNFMKDGTIFELTKREQKIVDQLRIVITDRNFKEENFKKELHSKENKYLKEFLDMKALKEKYKVAIGYKNPVCLTRAKHVQPSLYNGHEIIKTNHVPAIVHNLEETLEIAEITRKKMNEKINDLECVKKKAKIASHDYSKENYLATFTSQKQLTPKQIFWLKNLIKMKAEALKEQTTALRPMKALTVFSDMHEALNAAQKRIAELASENLIYKTRFKMMITM